MSSRRERMVSDLDREIVAAESTLDALKAARRALAPLTRGRKPRDAGAQAAFEEGSLELAAATVMRDGHTWGVSDVHKAIQEAGVPTERATVNSMLYRASKREGGRLEKVGRGLYRLKSAPKAQLTLNGGGKDSQQREGTTLPQ